jgi:hypothetical protein
MISFLTLRPIVEKQKKCCDRKEERPSMLNNADFLTNKSLAMRLQSIGRFKGSIERKLTSQGLLICEN